MIDPERIAARPEDVGIDPRKVEALLARVRREVDEGLLPAAQVALAREGKLAVLQTFGRVLHQGQPAPATDDTLFCVFSCTKGITSAAAWLLIQEGKLSPDELVAEIVPEFGTHGKERIRVEQLLTHTAGFPGAPFDPARFLDREYRLERFASWRLHCEPGSRIDYHPTSSMYLVAENIERRSGRSYGAFVRERIALPLGLPDLWVGLPRSEHGRLADYEAAGAPPTDEDYAKLGVPKPPVTEVTPDALSRFNLPEVRESGIPGGGGTMKAADLALFYQALLTGRANDGSEVWKPETLRMGLTVRSGDLRDPLYGKRANRALGMIIAGDDDRAFRGFGHTNSPLAFGHNGAGGQIAWADPATGISFAYCTSGFDQNPMRLARRSVSIGNRAAVCAL